MGNPARPSRPDRAVPGLTQGWAKRFLAPAILAALAAAGIMAPASADAQCKDPKQLAARSGTIPFKQTRVLKGVSRPMISRGEAQVSASEIVWRISRPVEIVTRIRNGIITQSVDGGTEEAVAPGGGDTFLTETGLADLLRSDLAAVETRYSSETTARSSPPGWVMRLKPKDARLSPFVSTLSIEACQAIESIVIEQADGESIRVDFDGGAK